MVIKLCFFCLVFDVISVKLYADATTNYADVNELKMACQWQDCTVATEKLKLVELSVFVESDRLIGEQVFALCLCTVLQLPKLRACCGSVA